MNGPGKARYVVMWHYRDRLAGFGQADDSEGDTGCFYMVISIVRFRFLEAEGDRSPGVKSNVQRPTYSQVLFSQYLARPSAYLLRTLIFAL